MDIDLPVDNPEEVAQQMVAEYLDHDTVVQNYEDGARAESSVKGYIRNAARIIYYHHKNLNVVLSDYMRRYIQTIEEGGGEFDIKAARDFLSGPGGRPAEELPFSKLFTVEVFKQYLTSLRTRNDRPLGKSALGGHRGALSFIFRLYSSSEEYLARFGGNQMTDFLKGAARMSATRRSEGEESPESGKNPVEFALLNRILQELLSKEKDEAIFARHFLLTLWNLMSRSVNVQHIRLCHVKSESDYIAILFSQSKTDQEGTERYWRHIYANPVNPNLCWFTSLGLYFLCFPGVLSEEDGLLFPGSRQYERFSKEFYRVLTDLERDGVLQQFGMTVSKIGSHSFRKGAASFAASGSAGGGPSIVAIILRCGWSLPGVQDTYFKHMDAGDQYLGRVLAGLSPTTVDFALLPHFCPMKVPIVP